MKKSILIILTTLLIISCTSGQNIDLAEIKMPYSSENLLNKNYDLKKENFGYFIDLQKYTSYNSNLLNFDKVNFSGELNDNFLNKNHIEIQVDDKEKTIPYLKLEIFTTKQSNKLYKTILNKLGKPAYYTKNKDFFHGAWEKGNITYLLELNHTGTIDGIKTTTSYLTIIDNTIEKLTERYYSAGFGYFGDYVKARKKKGNPNYTYEEFAKYEAEENWTEYYLDEIKNNEPL